MLHVIRLKKNHFQITVSLRRQQATQSVGTDDHSIAFSTSHFSSSRAGANSAESLHDLKLHVIKHVYPIT